MTNSCEPVVPKVESPFQGKAGAVSREMSVLHETITNLTDIINEVLKPEDPGKICEDKDNVGNYAPIEKFLDITIIGIQHANERLNSLIKRCVL